MSYRLLSGVITDFSSWRIAVMAIGCCALAAALMFWKILPASRHFRPASLKPRSLMINFRLHWRDSGLPLLFTEGFLLMGAFVTLFNYIGYRLLSPPYSMNQAIVGLLSVVYLTGSWSSPKAGAMTAKYGRAPVLLFSTALMLTGLLITLASNIWFILPGMMLFTAGFLRHMPLPAAGLAIVRAALKARPLHCTCSVIIWGRALPEHSAVFFGIISAGKVLRRLLPPCWCWRCWLEADYTAENCNSRLLRVVTGRTKKDGPPRQINLPLINFSCPPLYDTKNTYADVQLRFCLLQLLVCCN